MDGRNSECDEPAGCGKTASAARASRSKRRTSTSRVRVEDNHHEFKLRRERGDASQLWKVGAHVWIDLQWHLSASASGGG